jgi:hypothetical protein
MPSDQQTQTFAGKKPLRSNEIAPIGYPMGAEKPSVARISA